MSRNRERSALMHCLRTVPGFNVNDNSTIVPPSAGQLVDQLDEPSQRALVQLAYEIYDGRNVYGIAFHDALFNLTNTDRHTFIEALGIAFDEWCSVVPLGNASPDLPVRGEDRGWRSDRADEFAEHPISTRAERLRGQ